MNEKEVKKRKEWQEKVYNNLKKITKKQEIKILGKKIIVLPGVFAPLWGDSLLLAKSILKEVKKDDEVLDLGTGTGIQGIFAAEKAKKVISVDINPQAVRCASLNVKNNGLTDKITVFQSNLFSNIKDKFSLVIFNPPFRWFKPRDVLEMGEVDEDYKTLRRFFKEIKRYLKPEGRILLVFSESGDLKYLEKLIEANNFKFKIMDEDILNNWKYKVYKISAK